MNHQYTEQDSLFRLEFESGSFPAQEFDHEAHLRLAYIYLCENGVEQSLGLMKNSILNFLDYNNVDPSKYHETMTKAWILAVKHFMEKDSASKSAAEFIANNPEMLNPKIMYTHYSTELMFSDEARKAFVQPNLDPIPRYQNR